MPMLTTLRMRLPVWPFQAPLRTRFAKSAIRSSTAWTSGTTFSPSTTIDAPFGARRATCRTARFSVTLIFSPRNIASIRSRRPDSSASCSEQRERLVGDAVLRVVEEEAGGLERQPLAALRVLREELAQVQRRAIFCVVRRERLPGRARRSSGATAPPATAQLAFPSAALLEAITPISSFQELDERLRAFVLQLRGQRVDVDRRPSRTPPAPPRSRRRRPASIAPTSPWSAKAFSVPSGMVLTVNGAASALT